MTALITGASSGIGRDIARELAKRDIKIIISGRNYAALEKLRDEIGALKIITADLTKKEDCYRLYEEAKEYDIDILINNAGFGLFGKLSESNLEREIEMIEVNVMAMHILQKLFLRDFIAKDKGYILNVASVAGFMPGPYMATYYATKNYVVRITEALSRELKNDGSNVSVSALCPGPVNTKFNDTAGVSFALKGISSEYAAKCAVKGLFARKTLIIPKLSVKLAAFASQLVPPMFLTRITGHMQKKKGEV